MAREVDRHASRVLAAAIHGGRDDAGSRTPKPCCLSCDVDASAGEGGFVGSSLGVALRCIEPSHRPEADDDDAATRARIASVFVKFAPAFGEATACEPTAAADGSADDAVDVISWLRLVGVHRRECAFYNVVAPRVAAAAAASTDSEAAPVVCTQRVVPTTLVAMATSDGLGAIVMEDLCSRPGGAATTPLHVGLGVEAVESALRALASVHALTWGERIEGDDALAQPPEPSFSCGLGALLAAALPGVLDQVVERVAGSVGVSRVAGSESSVSWREAVRRVRRLATPDGLLAWRAAHDEEAAAQAGVPAELLPVLHGDLWCGNVLHSGAAPRASHACLVDWQFAGRGPPLDDVAVLIGTSMRASDRRRHLPRLAACYSDALASALGLRHPPLRAPFSSSECAEGVRRAMPAAVVLAVVSAATWEEAAAADEPGAAAELTSRWAELIQDAAGALPSSTTAAT
mmetsp:Transcript_26332/g.91590  ORF Transcript_26332/g.91590 Transcript_26332/m.91590 type:complete len:461 (-) Transcript_26332:94-1476(-)